MLGMIVIGMMIVTAMLIKLMQARRTMMVQMVGIELMEMVTG